MKKLIIAIATCMIFGMADAQDRRQMGGIYRAYPYASKADNLVDATPEGYTPFYLSHYGRHGSRWMTNDERYEWLYSYFADRKNLTPLGRKVEKAMRKVLDNARGNGGRLSRLGAIQHEGIARRMYSRLPQIFAPGNRVKARASVVDRCVKSMLAFTAMMQSLQPALEMDIAADSADMAWIAYTAPEVKELEKSLYIVARTNPDRFMAQLFKDPSRVAEHMRFMSEMQAVTSSLQDVGLNFKRYPKDIETLFDGLFTDDEFRAFYCANNLRMTICNGNYATNDGIPARSALSLWQNIVDEADAALMSSKPSATLRFGHDTSLYRLLTLLNMRYNNPYPLHPDTQQAADSEHSDLMDVVVPMAANLQMVFYRKTTPDAARPDDDVLVRFMLNERNDIAENPDFTEFVPGSRLYRWTDIKACMQQRIHRLEHLRQLHCLNTMVGTAQANTNTAGLFGKGSEEHGQTLPAVLVPNGQNFWTPQTQDTEQKCIAPYYYKDSLLQGFRNSHWIVGGCTQDYGSFTVAAISGKLRLLPEERATRFSHDREWSHPHYYAVRLDDEHLLAELTADSHASLLRVTPDADQTVHIVINANSDEQLGYIEVDTLNRMVYGYNPVHRIYQGWGEPAGFSGHFVLRYYDELADFGMSKGQTPCLWLSFKARAHTPLLFATASSFTGKEGAIANLKAELSDVDSPDFGRMVVANAEKWIDRFHSIDVETADLAKVNQFYGAFYRASFLPREMSDCNDDYPCFSSGETKHIDSSILPTHSTHKYFGDFSMWDVYRAQLPLYNIIAPTLSGQMMQSLVDMYDSNGWLPIFPCWNSYTAAMIGDHCSVALADAYVKGVRNFDAHKAYDAMRKNAFESPASYDEYTDGMGRRALDSYIKYGYIPMEDSVKEAFHTCEQTSRTLEYAYDDFAVAQMAKALSKDADYNRLMDRCRNWRNVINPATGWADGRHADGSWQGCTDLVSRQSFITEGSICHYSWYVPHDIQHLIYRMGGEKAFEQKLDMMFGLSDSVSARPLYWHGNEPCHQIPYLYNYIGKPEKTRRVIRHILDTEYNDTPGGLSGNDDAGQMSAWYMFSAMGFYPVCPAFPLYQCGVTTFDKVTFNLENGKTFTVLPGAEGQTSFSHEDITSGGTIRIAAE